MHCSVIRINLNHITNKETKRLGADPDMKKMLKAKKFKWKTVINDNETGERFEILEA